MTNDRSLEDEQRLRKPYAKPTIVQIALRPDEAVLGNCKTSGGAGPGNSSCAVTVCSTLSS